MKQDMNDTFRIALQAMVMAAMTLLTVSTATAQDTPTGPRVRGNVYGGGNAADVKINTTVNIETGTVEGNVYGGGNVGDVGMYTVTINDKGSKDYTWQQVNGEETGKCIVNVSGGTVGSENIATTDHASGHVFGAGKGKDDTFECEKAMVRTTSVSIDNCTVWGNVYGGGQVGRVDQHTAVTIGNGEGVESGSTPTSKPIIKGNVFGAGAGLETHGYSALVRGNAEVIVQGNSKVEKSVYGGGEIAAVGRYGLDGSGMPTTLISGGECKVTVRGYSEIGTDAGGGVFGAGEGVVPHYYVGVDSYTDNADKPKRMMNFDQSIYNDQTQNDWERIEGTDFVWEYYNTRDGYLNFLQTLALATDAKLIIDGHAKVHGSVYGGSRSGFVQRYTDVTIQGSCEILTIETEGKIEDGNVFGGGKGLTGNDAAGRVRGNITLYTLGGTMHGSVYGGGALSKSNTLVSEGVYPTSIVNLLGGTVMGDAYGGGLGNATTAADAGNTKVNLNGMAISEFANLPDGVKTQLSSILTLLDANNDEDTNDEGVDYYSVTTTTKGCVVNRVFGANNTNGTPKGNVMVHVYGTQYKDATQIGNPGAGGDSPAIAPKEEGRYDVEAVYGGGNEAAYIPETPYTTATPNGSKSQVIIDGCDYTSIETVYGGGNAAPVPESNVEIRAAYEIGYVFGGGNGKDKKSDGSENPGADIGQKSDGTEYGTGNANSTLEGGLIHEAYGGSNQKGVIKGSINQTTDPDASACELDLRKVVGAGKYADIDQDVNMILSCQPENKVDVLFAGADEANVNGNITLTITNGNFGQVFGGNNLGGAVKGRIIVNVEETGCHPINIDELYLCGNNAAYSVYGYYQSDEVHPVTGKKILKPRESSDDEHKPVKDYDRENDSWTVYSGEGGDTFTSYGDPVLNVISCTHIGQVFGGGYGTGAIVYGNPTVNINMIQGDYANDIPSKMTALGIDATEAPNTNKLGIIGDVYGGGNAADVIGNPTVNIGTEPTVDLVSKEETGKTVLGAYIAGNVYGGGKGASDTYACEKAMIGKDGDGIDNPDGGTTVRIYKGLVRGNVYGGGEIGRVEKNTAVTIGAENGTDVPVVMGDVFGAGKGLETHGYAALVRGNPTVTIQGKAKVLHSVYGGGQIASVARYQLVDGVPVALAETNGKKSGYCTVNILGDAVIGPDKKMVMHHMDEQGNTVLGDDGFPLLPDDAGHVFAAGKGVLPIVYDYAKPTSTVQANYHTEQYEIDEHMPKRMMLYKNKKSQYWEYSDSDFDPTGVDEGDLANQDVWEYFPSEKDYFDFVETLALATQTNVTISGNAFVKGSVYGGSENGLVQYNTNVMIEGECQIGCGKNTTDRHPAPVWGDNYTVPDGTDLECASWEYDKSSGAPYDPNAKYLYDGKYYYDKNHENDAAGGSIVGKDGHTFYGNVFGGGSGSVPYFDTNQGRSRYVMSAGWVKGNTNVTINGGHILTNVYGGNEATNVDGTATVTMNGGTIGVPRTLAQIDAHPVTCYLFGAGKGDQRVFFNKDTNVKDVVVNITGGRIYGSVFGGGEDGHVLRDVTMTIGTQTTTGEGAQATTTTSGPTIGTWGTSYVDGNVFGGGRGFGGDAYTAGNVAGRVTMNINGGTMLGSIYGGGRLGSVGYGLFDETTNGQPTQGYGEMREDNDTEEGFVPEGGFTHGRGHIDITISGGTIGNDYEYIVPNSSNIPNTITEADISKWTSENWATWKTHNHIPKTEFDASGRLTHTKGGNVFAGGMGRQTKLDGQTLIDGIDWWKLGCVKQTKLTITGGHIKSNVYGGGELGAVIFASGSTTEGGTTEIDISGLAVIGTPVTESVTTGEGESVQTDDVPRYTFGSVFGGGMGSENYTSTEEKIGGRVAGSTKITMTGGDVKASVYGGGELAIVQGSHTAKNSKNEDMSVGTEVNISGGTIGYNQDGFGGATMGNVYGGGKGSLTTANAGLIKNNTLVKITGTPTIYHNIYGGGAYGSVGTFTFTTGVPTSWTDDTGKAEVIVEGGTIGINGHENGMVFGSSRGDVAAPTGSPAVDPNDRLAWVYDTHVVIGNSSGGPTIKGTVYGSGENGHTFNNTLVDVNKGTIGIETGEDITYTEKGKSLTKGGAAYPYRGNVYGGGCGTDMYDSNGDGTDDTFNPLAGIVLGDATVNINGGKVVRNVYGAGAMGSVGKTNSTGAIVSGGLTAITISGGQIGVDGTAGDGNVFGAARGDVVSTQTGLAQVKSTTVSMSNGTVWSNIYGGGEAGNVGTYTNTYTDTGSKNYIWDKIEDVEIGDCSVSMTGGEVKGHVFGAGKGEDNTFECEKAMVRSSSVSISNGTVDGNVYGGGEVGRVDQNAKVEIGVGTGDGPFAPTIKGNVFGAGAGKETHGYSALVRGNTEVIVEGNAKVEKSVYGGGEIAAVGRYGLDVHKMPTTLVSGGECKVTIRGKAEITNNVFGAGEGVVPHFDKDNEDKSKRSRRMTVYNSTDFPAGASTWEYYEEGSNFVWDYFQTSDEYLNYLQTLALATDTKVTIDGEAKVKGSVYGGSESGFVQRYTDVKILSGEIGTITTEGGATTTTGGNVFGGGLGISENETAGRVRGNTRLTIIGGTMHGSVYGGGALGKTNTEVSNDGVYPTATVNLLGGIIDGDAYGGGLGDASTAADAGNTVVNLNGLHAGTDVDETTLSSLTGEGKPLEANGSGYRVKSTTKGIVVGRIFGSNNLNGTPKGNVLVHVHSTQNGEATQIANTETLTNAKVLERYDVKAVYGGGNLAAYKPVKSAKDNSDEVKAQAYAEVIIDGCDLTSIQTVYGGGNAASVPATNITINGTYEIEEVFGGGNGKDDITINGVTQTNPGANVGYVAYSTDYDIPNSSKAERTEKFSYGSGKASVNIFGGVIHRVFGGSNTKGNVRETAVTMLEETGGCHFQVDEAYGGGKSAPMDAEAKLLMACIPGLKSAFGGAQEADILGGVTLTITNGTFDRVFGGNNISGTIQGPIVVNIEEMGCRPIIIGELYGGGNLAGYSIYGYNTDRTVKESGSKLYDDPVLNVKSFTSIGDIYGGGYGSTATMVASPTVNINVAEGKFIDKVADASDADYGKDTYKYNENGYIGTIMTIDGHEVSVPPHEKGKIGAIQNVYGGGNAAKVIGNPNVNIGTRLGEDEYMAVIVEDGETLTDCYTFTKASGTAVAGTTYYQKEDGGAYRQVTVDPGASVEDYYTQEEFSGAAAAGKTYYKKFTIKGADIRGNVYGGGNAAEVTGDTNVVIGKETTTTP